MFIKLELYNLYTNHNIFIIDQNVNNSIIITFIYNLNIFIFYKNGIIYYSIEDSRYKTFDIIYSIKSYLKLKK